MSEDYHFYEPSNGHGLAHEPLLAMVGPRPIGWISSLSPGGVRNLAPYSFFNIISGRPPLLAFASSTLKDSAANVEATGEFVWNLATQDLASAMNATSATVPNDTDEFDLAGLTWEPGRIIKAPRVREAAVSMECRLTEIVRPKDLNGKMTETRLVIGQVVGVHIRKSLVTDGIYDTAAARPILRGGGTGDYFEIQSSAHFFMARPEVG